MVARLASVCGWAAMMTSAFAIRILNNVPASAFVLLFINEIILLDIRHIPNYITKM